MLIIDRYLLRQFVRIFLICFLSLTGLYVVIDAFGNMEEFISYSSKQGSLLGTLGEYYGYRTLAFFDNTSSILTLISAMFTMAAFQRNNEMTALQAAGIPKWRIIRPVVGAVIGISLLAVVNREFVIPQFRERFSSNAQDLSGENGRPVEPRYDNRTNIYFSGAQTFAMTQQITSPVLRLPPDLSQYGSQIQAENAFFQKETADHPAGYLLKNVRQPKDFAKRPSLKCRADDARPTLLTPCDQYWLKPDECFIASDVSFEQLTDASQWQRYCSTWQLVAGLRNPSLDFRADVRVLIHSRLLQPFQDLTLLFLGLPLILARETRNMFLAIGMCLGIVVVFMIAVMAFQGAGGNYLIPASLAAWGPLIVFVPIAVYLSEPLRE